MKRATALICRLREIGVALVVLFALNAAAASPAWAVAELNPEQAPAVIRGINLAGEKLEFNLQGNSEKFKLACEFGVVEGKTTTKTVTQIVFELEISQCKIGVNKLTPKMNGCQYVWKMTAALTAKLDISGCTTGKVIEFATFGCAITIPPKHRRLSAANQRQPDSQRPHLHARRAALPGLEWDHQN
jgi:hypothetical protein